MKTIYAAVAVAVLLVAPTARAAHSIAIPMHLVSAEGIGKSIGMITATQNEYGLLLMPALSDLPPGVHGFHLHENPSCEPGMKNGVQTAALGAGGHSDPKKTGVHEGPYGKGHLGDLPVLFVTADGKADSPMLAPRLKLSDLPGHALVIHSGGDNYSDQPAPLGGGGPRIACGVVPK